MSDYSQITFFTPKDGLATGNPNKIIYGSDVDAELSAISTAIASKADVDGDAIGAGTPATEINVDNLKLDANKIISTNTDGDIELEPNGAGYVVITNVDVAAGEIDGTVIGGNSAAAGTFTTLNATTVDSTNLEVTNLKAKDGTAAGSIADVTGVVTLASSVLTTADINGGTVDGAVIGGATPAAITGTTLKANTSLELATGATVTAILDEDAMTSNSDTALATQQSIKAYVDAQVTAQDLDVTTDSGTIAIDLDSETLTVAGGTGLDTSATGNTVTVAIDSTVATLTGTQTLTNKTLTSPDINTPDIDGGTIDGATIATSDITVGAGKTLDVSAGTLTLANDQISGDSIEGGTIAAVTITSLTATTADINGGTVDGAAINSTTIGATTPAAGTFTDLTATEITASRLNVGANLAWNSSTDTYTANTTPSTVTKIHEGMKRCLLRDDGTVNYYLDPDDSTQKLDGSAADLTGADGNVMVEIPRFYFRQVKNGNTTTWEISDVPLAGYQLHPAFFKNGEIVDYRYIGAYDACYLDATDSTYKSGLNLDDMTSSLDLAADKLASVSGVYPLVGVTRDECRDLAANVGTGFRQQDFWLTCAVQLLYLVEYGTFYSQNELGAGNTNGSYVGSSSNQSDSPHTIAGASNALGNASTDGTQPSAGAKPGTAYMSYRGIENFFGNCWNWVDGFNIGIVADRDAFVSNNDADFADNTSTNYTDLGITMASANGYVQNIADVPGAFLPNDTTGASSSTYLTDQFFQNTGNRVARFGGPANYGASAGAFCWNVSNASSLADRIVGARLAY